MDGKQFDRSAGGHLDQRPGCVHGDIAVAGTDGELTSQFLARQRARGIQPDKDCRYLTGAQIDRWRRERELESTVRIMTVEEDAEPRSSALVVQRDLHSGAIGVVDPYDAGLDPHAKGGHRCEYFMTRRAIMPVRLLPGPSRTATGGSALRIPLSRRSRWR